MSSLHTIDFNMKRITSNFYEGEGKSGDKVYYTILGELSDIPLVNSYQNRYVPSEVFHIEPNRF